MCAKLIVDDHWDVTCLLCKWQYTVPDYHFALENAYKHFKSNHYDSTCRFLFKSSISSVHYYGHELMKMLAGYDSTVKWVKRVCNVG